MAIGAMSSAGARPTTIRDVAQTAGVSVGTVSRSLNAPDTVRRATLEKVQAAIEQLGFKPDARAQGMRRRNTLAVGFISNDISNPVHAIIFRGAETELRGRGYSLHVVNTGGNAQREAEAIDTLQHGRVDGLIMTINSEQDRRCLQLLTSARVPSVLLDREIDLEIDAVLTDHATGMLQAVDYLIELGHRRIALLTAGMDIRPGRERVRGFTAAFTRRKIACPKDLIRAQSLSADFGFRETSALLQLPDPPTALIAGGNQILVGVLKAIQQGGVSVPRQLSLITCDRTDLSTIYPGPLTVIDRNLAEIGRTAAELLLQRMGEGAGRPALRISFPTHLILGRSCTRLARREKAEGNKPRGSAAN
jgi:LacI family transcriptional regulator